MSGDRQPHVTRRLTAVVFADIVGYTQLSNTREEEALQLVRLLQDAARTAVETGGGRIVKFIGDAVLVESSSAEVALEVAISLGERFVGLAREAGAPSELRIGVHLGETAFAPDGDVYGDVVNVASRIQTAAEPGQVLVTEDVRRQLLRRHTFAFEESGIRNLRGVEEPVGAYVASRRYQPAPSLPAPANAEAVARRRVGVIPFQLLGEGAELEYLSFGLADAIAGSLSLTRGLVVRATASMRGFEARANDPLALAAETQLDLLVLGTILRHRDRVRVTSQLIDGEHGSIIWTGSEEAAVGDLFELQDHLAQNIASALASPLDGPTPATSGPTRAVQQAAPEAPAEYGLYLHANQLSLHYGDWQQAAELYETVVRHDPDYAPAWARLGRCHRLLGKYALDREERDARLARAEACLTRAVQQRPDSALAQSFLAQFEVEAGRSIEGMRRLLARLRVGGASVDVYAGLVHALRYVGLDGASLTAAARARELDPAALTSEVFTHLVAARYPDALQAEHEGDFAAPHIYLLAGRLDEAEARLSEKLENRVPPTLERWTRGLFALARGQTADALELCGSLSIELPDPEARYLAALHFSRAGEVEMAGRVLESVVREGYYPVLGLRADPNLDPMRAEPYFGVLVERAESGQAQARAAFEAEGGARLLGWDPEGDG